MATSARRTWPSNEIRVWPVLRSCVLAALIILLSAYAPPAGPSARPCAALAQSATAPPQASGLEAVHRAGQTFLTWQERAELRGERYRVYRSAEPITAANLDQSTLLYEVPEGAARFFANRYYSPALQGWAVRYLERMVIADHGAELDPDTGLFVWTLSTHDLEGERRGAGYYAVTTVLSDVENVHQLTATNTVGPVAESVDDPQPVELATGPGPNWQILIQYMDLRTWNPTFHAPHAANSYYGLDREDPAVSGGIQYAYDYAVYRPTAGDCSGALPDVLPVVLMLHSWGGNTYGPPSARSARPWCAYQIYPVDVSETWWFGFAREHDYRSGTSGPRAGDTIANYTEQRMLRMVYDLSRSSAVPPVDLDRVYVYGHSMGASGALALALRYPNVLAAAYASKPMTDYRQAGGWKGTVTPKWGSEALNLPVHLEGPGDWASGLQGYQGTGVWDWQNHQRALATRRGDDMAPFGLSLGINDTSIPWDTQGAPMYAALYAGDQACAALVTEDGHSADDLVALPPALARDDRGAPFAGLSVVRSETVPGLGAASGSPSVPPTATCGLNQTIDWSASWRPWDGAPIDIPSRWQMSLRTVGAYLPGLGYGPGTEQTVDITPRRVASFALDPGAVYHWANHRRDEGSLVQRGTATLDDDGLLVIPQVLVLPGGNRLSIVREGSHSLYLPIVPGNGA